MEGVEVNSVVYEAVISPIILYHPRCIKTNCRRKGEDPDFSEALIVRYNSSIEDVCDQIHRTLKETFKYAMVWGASARHIPQRVGLSHVVADEDVVSIVAK